MESPGLRRRTVFDLVLKSLGILTGIIGLTGNTIPVIIPYQTIPITGEAIAEVLPLKSQQRDGMLQAKIVPHFEKEEGHRLNRDQSSISPMCYNKHTPKAANNDTGNTPIQSYNRPGTRPMSKKTATIFDIVSKHNIPNSFQSVKEQTPKDSESKDKMTKREAISFSATTEKTPLPGIESFQPDVLIDQKKKHNIQGCSPGIGLRELHERSFRPWFAYRTARCKEVQAQLLSATKDVAQLNTRAEVFLSMKPLCLGR
ncbi:hypothetical protein IWW34DRAFT_894172 [Fusarium oxysporum f. sp. albedinis]|nr:hypothetical protein IWW34DRAFT_894172 [Fusarium oxysporum f. sp. albedinis]